MSIDFPLKEYSVQKSLALLSNTIRKWIDDNIIYYREIGPEAQNNVNNITASGIYALSGFEAGLPESCASESLLIVINSGLTIDITDSYAQDLQIIINYERFNLYFRTKEHEEPIYRSLWVLKPENVSYKGVYSVINENGNETLVNKNITTVIESPDVIKYVSKKTGNVANNGDSSSTPYSSISQAIEAGATIIHVDSDTYQENPISTSPKAKLHILANWPSSTQYAREKIVINFGEEISNFSQDETTGLKSMTYDKPDDYMKNAFTNFSTIKTYDNGYNRGNGTIVTLWKKSNNYTDQEKLTAVANIDQCKETDESWYYDGTNKKIYINTTHTGSFILSSQNNRGCLFENIDELILEDIEVNYPTYCGFEINNCNNVKVVNCGGQFAGKRNGFLTKNINGTFENCYGNRNANDGFAPCGVGNTIFTNCEAHYNYDDGISHHEGCTGSIIGGYYSHNGKGGVSPAHGAIINCYNVFSINNTYGFYCVDGATEDKGRKMMLVNCYAKNSKECDIKVSNYHITAVGCSFKSEDVEENSFSSLIPY